MTTKPVPRCTCNEVSRLSRMLLRWTPIAVSIGNLALNTAWFLSQQM
jgi:hypothetical protein